MARFHASYAYTNKVALSKIHINRDNAWKWLDNNNNIVPHVVICRISINSVQSNKSDQFIIVSANFSTLQSSVWTDLSSGFPAHSNINKGNAELALRS